MRGCLGAASIRSNVMIEFDAQPAGSIMSIPCVFDDYQSRTNATHPLMADRHTSTVADASEGGCEVCEVCNIRGKTYVQDQQGQENTKKTTGWRCR